MADIGLRKPAHHPRTASRVFGGEAVIISPTANMVRMLNPVGSRIWELVDGSRTVEDIAQVLAGEFDVDLSHARDSVALFLQELAGKELLVFDTDLPA
jgi:hypothetical protein